MTASTYSAPKTSFKLSPRGYALLGGLAFGAAFWTVVVKFAVIPAFHAIFG